MLADVAVLRIVGLSRTDSGRIVGDVLSCDDGSGFACDHSVITPCDSRRVTDGRSSYIPGKQHFLAVDGNDGPDFPQPNADTDREMVACVNFGGEVHDVGPRYRRAPFCG
jgi:hypothetical protein